MAGLHEKVADHALVTCCQEEGQGSSIAWTPTVRDLTLQRLCEAGVMTVCYRWWDGDSWVYFQATAAQLVYQEVRLEAPLWAPPWHPPLGSQAHTVPSLNSFHDALPFLIKNDSGRQLGQISFLANGSFTAAREAFSLVLAQALFPASWRCCSFLARTPFALLMGPSASSPCSEPEPDGRPE